MDYPIIDLMHACVVKLVAPAPGSIGSGFFVAPGLILTCAHVVGNRTTKKHCNGDIQVRWKEHEKFAAAKVKEWKPDLDIALLTYATDQAEIPPCALFGRDCRNGHRLVTFGYPRDFPNGDPADFVCTGYTGDDPPFIRFKDDRVRGGMSGSPVLNLETKRVCGMVKFTVDTRTPEGGGGIWADTILKHFKELEQLQEQHHQQESRWFAVAGIKTPGNLSDRVQEEIEKILSKPGLDMLQKSISNALKAEHRVIAQTPAEIASKLIEMEEPLTLLLKVRMEASHQWREAGKADKEIESMRSAVLDIIGWRVLEAVNTAWIAQNRDKLYLQEFPGAIAMPVLTDSGIEIIHAAIQERCARFNSIEGKLLGAERMPAIDHEFLEDGFDTDDIVRDIKKAIYQHINRKRGIKEKVPDSFTPEVDKHFNAKLKVYNAIGKNVYFVVRRSGDRSPLNDHVYKKLKTDLPDLQVIFHESEQAGHAFVVDETELNSTLEFFFDAEDQS